MLYRWLPPVGPTEFSATPTTTMASLKLMTWNFRGLCAKPKRVAIPSHLKSLRADVSVLTEIHVTDQMQMALKKH